MFRKINKCFFFDRDGVLNKDKGYISKIKDIELYPKIGQAIYYCNKKGYLVIIITNQSGIGRGLITISQLNNIHNFIKKKIRRNKAYIDDIFFCPYHPSAKIKKYIKISNDRKPNPGMILKAIKKWKIDSAKSFMIGDKVSDRSASKAAGVKFFFKSKKVNLYDQIKHIIKNYE